MILRARSPYVLRRRRGMSAGQPGSTGTAILLSGRGAAAAPLQDPCACFYPLPGVPLAQTNPNNVPQCNPVTGLAPGCTVDEPPCGGIAYGAPGYAACAASLGESAAALAQQTANLQQMTGVAQSNAPNPKAVARPVTGAFDSANPSLPTQSNAPGSTAVVPVAATPAGCFALFGDQSCWGPIGSTTALVLGGGLFGLWLLFGGHR